MHTISVLHVPGCAGGQAALEVANTLAGVRHDVSVDDVVVETDDQAMALPFRGSPTVLVDGQDIEDDPQTPIGSMG